MFIAVLPVTSYVAPATVSFAEGKSDTQTEKAGKLATAPGSGAPHVTLNSQALSVTSASNPATEGLTTFEVDAFAVEAPRAGASGFLGKGVEPAQLLDAVRLIAAGEALLAPSATKGLISRFLSQPASYGPTDPERLSALTPREREVMTLVATGLSNQDIAERLFVTPVTVKTHLNRAMANLAARDRAQLVVIAYETGMVRPGLS
ncbi:DNA-binding response regulator [Streptomyces sp. NPDC058694]|uniref:DNA-binding response regulator n=1 Tax=Streptomyces sp. NPDC058694 TaxID=3346603 RepID=UPI003654A2F7